MNMGAINWLAVLVCILFAMLNGMIWYHPKVFYTTWREGIGRTDVEMNPNRPGPMLWGLTVLAIFVEAVSLAIMTNTMKASSAASGAAAGAMLWLGFVAPTNLVNKLFAGHGSRCGRSRPGTTWSTCWSLGQYSARGAESIETHGVPATGRAMEPMYDDAQAWHDAEDMGMTVYYVYLLKKGPAWSPDSTPEIMELQEQHVGNLMRLAGEGKLVLNGPLLDSFQLSGEIRGIGVLKASSIAEAQEWISTDPMVKIGRLVFELHAWMVQKGILP